MTVAPVSAGNRAERRHSRGALRRIAPQHDFQVRELDNGLVEFTGYAAVFNQRSQGLPFVEVIDAGAFRDCLAGGPDVALVLNHNPDTVIARTTAGNLTLTEDSHGLLVTATLNPDDPDAARAIVKLRDGNWRSMSFMFWDLTPAEDRTVTAADGTVERHVTRADIDMGDVAIVTYPAYAGTEAGVRSGRVADVLAANRQAARAVARAYIAELVDLDLDLADEELSRARAATRAAGFSHDDTWRRVDRALENVIEVDSDGWYGGWWLTDLGDDWVVVRTYGECGALDPGWWQFPYTMATDGSCTFGDPIEVLPRTSWDPVPVPSGDPTDTPAPVEEPRGTEPGDTPRTITLDEARAATSRAAQ